MNYVTIYAPNDQAEAEKFIEIMELPENKVKYKPMDSKYLFYKSIVESKTANVKISNFPLRFSIDNETFADIMATNFPTGTIFRD